MNSKLRLLLQDLQSTTVIDCEGISAVDANALFCALQMAAINVDCAMVVQGQLDWKDERSRKLSLGLAAHIDVTQARTPNDCPKCGPSTCRCGIAHNE